MMRERVVSSALWSAWGDALGFMTELADAELLEQRTGRTRVDETSQWRRRLGGRFGVTVEMPAGSYSDDTQLRLSTARSIRPTGEFDVEAFSRVELPVFLAYGLGMGRGTKAAAKALGKSRATWTGNFFESRDASYIKGGGNGGAMRIQPHVWAASERADFESLVGPVIRNVVCTHGHPRAIVGAVFHACTLALTLEDGGVPDPAAWRKVVDWLSTLGDVILTDDELSQLWVPEWERSAGSSLLSALRNTSEELRQQIEAVGVLDGSNEESWAELVDQVGGFDPRTRGSATATVLLATKLAFDGSQDPARALRTAANTLGSDTDTIASMAGALLGAANPSELPSPVLDAAFIAQTASWLESVSRGSAKGSFLYPDLLEWSVPRSAVDLVGLVDDRFALAGLGILNPLDAGQPGRGSTPVVWQWTELSFGQTALIRRRSEPIKLSREVWPRRRNGPESRLGERLSDSPTLFDDASPKLANSAAQWPSISPISDTANHGQREPLSLEIAIDLVVGSGFPKDLVGECLIALALQDNGLEKAVAFSGAVAHALRERRRDPPA